jgi:hypothetical protein
MSQIPISIKVPMAIQSLTKVVILNLWWCNLKNLNTFKDQKPYVAKRRGSYENRQRIHFLMWTLASMFHRSISHLLTVQHLQDSNWLPALPDSLTIQRLTDTTTQQFNNTHFRSCISTLMQFQKKFFILIHRICTSSKTQAILAIRSSHKERRGSDGASIYCFYSPKFFSSTSATWAQLYIRRSGKSQA